MDTLGQHTVEGEVLRSDSKQLCPECGAIMAEADRLAEGRDLFVWYTCSKVNCDGQWLQKFSKDTKNV
jgi:ribosomal protein S27AE